MEYEDNDYSSYDYLEVYFHPWDIRLVEVMKSFQLWNQLLNSGCQIYGVSAMDVHDFDMIDITDPPPKVQVYSRDSSRESLLYALRQGHNFSSCGPQLDFRMEIDGVEYMMGDKADCSMGAQLRFKYEINSPEAGLLARIIHRGNVVHEQQINSSSESTVFVTTAAVENSWYRLELYRLDRPELMIAFSNPIFLGLK